MELTKIVTVKMDIMMMEIMKHVNLVYSHAINVLDLFNVLLVKFMGRIEMELPNVHVKVNLFKTKIYPVFLLQDVKKKLEEIKMKTVIVKEGIMKILIQILVLNVLNNVKHVVLKMNVLLVL